MTTSRSEHWEDLYRKMDPTRVSWFQQNPRTSVDLILRTGIRRDQPVIDVGGGTSLLVDALLDRGFSDLTVLDLAPQALVVSRERLGARAQMVTWLATDVTSLVPPKQYALWHDRAVFHFLTDPADRIRYVTALRQALLPGGYTIIATFGPEGPERCSGLPVVRYEAGRLLDTLGHGFRLAESVSEIHVTPSGKEQQFVYCSFQAVP